MKVNALKQIKNAMKEVASDHKHKLVGKKAGFFDDDEETEEAYDKDDDAIEPVEPEDEDDSTPLCA